MDAILSSASPRSSKPSSLSVSLILSPLKELRAASKHTIVSIDEDAKTRNTIDSISQKKPILYLPLRLALNSCRGSLSFWCFAPNILELANSLCSRMSAVIMSCKCMENAAPLMSGIVGA